MLSVSSLRHRAEFLAHLKPCESQSTTGSGPESGNWTLVDEGGEEVCEGGKWLLFAKLQSLRTRNHFLYKSVFET